MDNTTVSPSSMLDNSGTFAVSDQIYNSFKKVNNIITPIICTLGILGNCAGLVILIRDTGKRKMIIYYYLISLFIFDCLYMLMSLFFLLLELIEYLQLVDDNYIFALCNSCMPYLDIVLNHVTSALLIAMSLERMVALIYPFKVSRFVLTRFPKTIIFSLIIFSFGYTFPFLIAFNVNSTTTPLNTTMYFISVKQDYQQLIDKTTLIETSILHYLAPVLVFVVNATIIVSYSRHVSQKDQILRSSSGNEGQIKITAIIVTVSVLYLLLSLPNMLIQTLTLVDKDYRLNGRYRTTVRLFFDIGDLLFNINAASDFPIYVLVSTQYRKAIFSWVCRCSGRKDSDVELNVLSKATRESKISGSNNSIAVVADIVNLDRIDINRS